MSKRAQFHRPCAIAAGPNDALYVADAKNRRIRIIRNGRVSTLADSASAEFGLNKPICVAVSPTDGAVYVVDTSHVYHYNRVCKILNNDISVVESAGEARSVAVGPDGAAYIASHNGIMKIFQDKVSVLVQHHPGISSIAVDAQQKVYFSVANVLLRAKRDGQVSRICSFESTLRSIAVDIDLTVHALDTDGALHIIPGGDPALWRSTKRAACSSTCRPSALTVDSHGLVFFVCKKEHSVKMLRLGDEISTLAGTGGPGFSDGPTECAQPFCSIMSLETARNVALDSEVLINTHEIRLHESFINLRCPRLLDTSLNLYSQPIDLDSVRMFESYLYSDLLPEGRFTLRQLLSLAVRFLVRNISQAAYNLHPHSMHHV